MPLSDLTSPEAVEQTLAEFDAMGREEFLAHYGYGHAKRYFIERNGTLYDSKAIFGVAIGFQYPDRGYMRNDEFSGGESTVVRILAELGFTIQDTGVDGGDVDGQGSPRTGRFRRDDLTSARAVFDAAVPRPSQSLCAELLADLIELADATRHGCWTINMFPRHVVLIVGNAYVASFRPERAFFTLEMDGVDDNTTAELEELAARAAPIGEWRSAPSFRSFEFSYEALEQAQRLFEPPLRAAVVNLATRFRRSPFTEAYSLGLVRYLSEITKRALPEIDLGGALGGHAAWVFQANPDIYAIDRAVLDRPVIEWTVRQHRAEVHAGDRVYLWRSGGQAGVVAVGTVMDEPTERPPADVERPFYLRPEAFDETELRVDVRIDHVLDDLLSRRVLADDPVLGQMTIIRMQGRGTNFRLTKEQDVALRHLVDGEPVPSNGGRPERFFVLMQRQVDGVSASESTDYKGDVEGRRYHFSSNSSGAWKRLSEAFGARFVYYRPGNRGADAQTFFGWGTIGRVDPPTDAERELLDDDESDHYYADVTEFHPFSRSVPRLEYDPRSNGQISIAEISRQQFEELLRLGGEQPVVVREPFTVDAIMRAASEPPRSLSLDAEVYASVFAALESGKHVILTGPPGTAKTTLAEAVAEAAARAGRCDGHVLTTATADWTTYETIGGLKPSSSGELVFAPGHFLDAIERNHWLVIDELNRSNFDRAFGQLFTVLSGQSVQLPYSREGEAGHLALVPEGSSAPSGSDELRIPTSWRLIATMNVFDKSLLFEMSFALMRRFAFIEVPSPKPGVFEDLIAHAAENDTAAIALTVQFLGLREHKDLGPALFMDMARYLIVRLQTDGAQPGQLAYEAFYSYLLPQFEGIDQATGERVFASVKQLVGTSRTERLRRTLNAVLGLEISAPAFAQTEDEEEVFEPDEPDLDDA